MHANNVADCYKYIEELEKISKEAKAFNEKIKEEIDKLELMLKEKEIEGPSYYEKFYEKADKINKKQDKLVKDYF